MYIVISLLLIFIAVCFINKYGKFMMRFPKYFKLVVILIIAGFFSVIFVVNAKQEKKENYPKEISFENNFNYSEIKDITYNKVVIVGDSRMENILFDKDKIDIPINFVFDAKGRATINWFKEKGLPKLRKILDNKNDKYHYHVVINMGINDIQEADNIKERVNEYFILYKQLYLEYNDIDFYILSVNPVDDKILNKVKNSRRTNSRVKMFNDYNVQNISKIKSENISYCNSYDKLDFNLPDGLHFDNETSQNIIRYITDECINYK